MSILPRSPPVENQPLPKAVGYVRVSTSDQAENGVSLEAQESRIRSWCMANGYDLAAIHSDAGLSGSRADNRPELQKALRAASTALRIENGREFSFRVTRRGPIRFISESRDSPRLWREATSRAWMDF